MKSLVKCDFYKIYKEKAHLVLLFVMVGLIIFSYLIMFALGKIMEDLVYMEGIIEEVQSLDPNSFVKEFNFLTHTQLIGGLLGLVAVLSISINISNDYRNRTINLKVLSGNSRTKILSSTIIVNYSLFFIFFIVCFLISLGGGLLLGGFGVSAKSFIINSLLMLCHYLAIVAITIFISTSLKSTLGIVINMVVLIGISQFLGMIGLFLAEQSKIFRHITEIMPYTALLNLSLGVRDFDLFYLLRNILGALGFLALGITGSFIVFRKKELA